MKSDPIRVLLVPDKFKGSLSAEAVMRALAMGVKQVYPKAQVHSVLASDGGDGFLDAIAKQLPSQEIIVETVDPLGRTINAVYLWDDFGKTAYVEMASASGVELLAASERKVLQTSTLGTGMIIKDAIAKGARSVYIGLGGSATNDAGTGIAAALGYRFLDVEGNEVAPIGENLSKIATIDNKEVPADIDRISLFAVNDVDNPLYGKKGAAHTYAEQKGASKEQIKFLDQGLRHVDRLIKQQLGKDLAKVPGAGAAGGTAYGLQVFLNAKYISGTDFILDLVGVEDLLGLQQFDYIITGEGKFDAQTLNGKLIKGVVDLGKKYKVPVIAVCGKREIDEKTWKEMGLMEVLGIQDQSMSDAYSMANASGLIQEVLSAYLRSI